MKTEYEVRLLEIDPKKMREKLEKLGATLEDDYLQKRYVYEFSPKQEGKWIRLRNNGKTTTLTIKNITSNKIDGTKELEIVVNDFNNTNEILKELGYLPKGYQENRREKYYLDGVEIDIDYWPLIPTYLEVEGKSEQEVLKTIEKLGFKESDVTTKNPKSIYLDYGYNLDDIYELKLEEERK